MKNPFAITGMSFISKLGYSGIHSGTYQPDLIRRLTASLPGTTAGERHWNDSLERINMITTLDEIPEALHSILVHPARSTNSNIPLLLDSGDIRIVDATVVEYDLRRPRKGGIRIHPSADYNEIKSQALQMHWKLNLLELEYGGAKSGIEIAPSELSPAELERLVKQFTYLNGEVIGERKYIPAPDIGFGPQQAEWVRSAFRDMVGDDSPAVITGKPVGSSGLRGRLEATGLGLTAVMKEAYGQLGLASPAKALHDKTIAIQGFGTVGGWAANFFHKSGARVIAVSDSTGGVCNEGGLPIDLLLNRKKDGYPVTINPNYGQQITNQVLLELPVDVLVPAAVGEAINEDNVHNIKAQCILEGANGATTAGADRLLNQRGVLVIPGILANGGGVLASHLERIQNFTQNPFTRKQVFHAVTKQLKTTTANVFRAAKNHNLDLRTAAGLLAMRNVVTVIQNSGFQH